MPFIIGSTTPIMAFVAMAASTAFPPPSRMRTPAAAASGDSAATIPPLDITTDRPWVRSCALVCRADIAARHASTKTGFLHPVVRFSSGIRFLRRFPPRPWDYTLWLSPQETLHYHGECLEFPGGGRRGRAREHLACLQET